MTVALSFQDTAFDVVDRDGVPWLQAGQIGLALGYGQREGQIELRFASRSIRLLYDRHADEFTESMTAVIRLATAGGTQEARIFSPRGFHLLAMLARTPVAKAFRVWALDVIEKYGMPRSRPALEFSPTEQAALCGMPESAKQLVIKEASLVARENPESLPGFLSTVLHMYLATAQPPAIMAEVPEPPEITAFWDAWEQLAEAGQIRSHSASPSLVAVNLPEFIRTAREQGYYTFDRAELVRLLPESRRLALLAGNKAMHSPHTGKTVKCWVFRRIN